MDAVIKEYGEYIIAAIAVALVIFGVSGIVGLFENSQAAIDAMNKSGIDINQVSGNGLFGKYICLWLNRIM